MSSLLFLRGLRRGWLNLRRYRGIMTGVAAFIGVLFMAQTFLVLGFGAWSVQEALTATNDFRLSLRLGVPDRDVQEFLVALRQLPPVSSVEYVPREKAMEIERMAHPDIATFLESNAVNPFRDAAIVMIGSLTGYDELAAFARHPRWSRVIDPVTFASMETRREELQLAFRGVQMTTSGAFLLLAAASVALLLTVLTLVRRSAAGRREDLFVERMSGTDEASIVLPFATEIIVQLTIALLVSVICVALILVASPAALPFFMDVRLPAINYGPALIVTEFVAMIIIGVSGAVLGTRIQKIF